ncbi:MAG: LysM peptidoglycan-binding domain-containing protein [Acidimicrobiia bacterium]
MTPRNRLAGLAASLLILLLVAGTPLLLVTIGATPWHESLADLRTLLTSPDDGTLALLVISAVAWIAWAVMAVSFGVEILAAIRGCPAPRLPGLGLPQGLAGRLVAVAALLFAVAPSVVPMFTPQPAHAAPAVETPNLVSLPLAAPLPAVEASPSTATINVEPPSIEYTVRRGDSLWKIAEEHLGDGMRFREIIALNQAVLPANPDFIEPGLILRLPGDAETDRDEASEPRAEETHVVEPGDTLWDIADEELGDGERYPEIFEASRETVQPDGQQLTDPDLIRPGWALTIPGAAADPPVVEPPVVEDPPVIEPGGRHVGRDPDETTPPTDAPSTTPRAEHDNSPVASETDDGDDEKEAASWVLPGLVGGGALLAGAVLAAIRAHRRTQQRYRRPGFMVEPPPPEVRAVERTATVAGGPTAEVIVQLDLLLRHLATSTSEPPTLDAVEVGKQSVTLHLAKPADLPEPWSGADTTWSAELDSPVADEDVLPPYPLLASIGQGADGHMWLLDLERLGSIALTGDPGRALALARHLAAELALSPWAVIAIVDTIDVAPELADLDALRLRVHPADDTEFLDRLRHDLARDQEDGHGDPEPFRVLLVAGDRSSEVCALAELVQHQTSRSGFSVVTIGEAEPGDLAVELTSDGRLRVQKMDLDLLAAGLTADEATATAAIVDLTRESSVVPMPREDEATGWRALADQAGALLPELTEARPAGEAGSDALLPEAPQRYEAVASTTADDVATLAPVVPKQTRRAVEETDPELDADLAEWHDSASPLPKLQLLGPVTVTAPSEPPEAVTERRAYFTELVTYLALHPAGVSSRLVRDAFGISQSRARTDLGSIREWFGISARSDQPHLPAATTSPAHAARGVGGYQLHDVLVDFDLFRRLRVRAQAHGADGMADLGTALELVTGEPFSALRSPGWSWLLDDERVHETAMLAVVDVAHIVATDAFSRGDLERARYAAEIGCKAAPYDEVCRLDLARVAEAEGHETLADQILDEHVFNRTDDHLPPIDLPDRTKTVVKNHEWGGPKRPGRG